MKAMAVQLDQWLDDEEANHLSSLISQVELLRIDANKKLDNARRSDLGQFMTAIPTAQLMASMLETKQTDVVLLDAGAGVGSLLAAAVNTLSSRPISPKSIYVVAYEIDPILKFYLQKTMELCTQYCANRNIVFHGEIRDVDFIQDTVDQLSNPLFDNGILYNCAILNPPYRKIQSNSSERRLLRSIGIETSNLYTGFLALTMELLAEDGEMVSITPRSFCNGPYFRVFRERLLKTMALRRLHIFESRDLAFSDDDVLQENVILSAVKTTRKLETVTITVSSDPSDEMPLEQVLEYSKVVHLNDPQSFIHLVTDEGGVQIADRMAMLPNTLEELGITVSTGRVVDFRAEPYLRSSPTNNTAPLLYPVHLNDGSISWPKLGQKKANAIVVDDAIRDLFVPNEPYVLVKRFSSKEETRRVVASVYDGKQFDGSVLGIENHLNYYHCNGSGLELDLACGLALFLNSSLVDSYFRQFNGHTQINATDLRLMRYPSKLQLISIGKRVGIVRQTQEDIDAIIEKEILGMSENDMTNPFRLQQRINEALNILRDLGMPRKQQNERSALTLLALLDLTPDKSWADATTPLRGITPMMEFFAQHYGKNYKPNTRETVRRQTVHQFLQAGFIVANPDDPKRAVTSKWNVYQVEPSTLQLLRQYGTPGWEEALSAYSASIETLQSRYAQERVMQRIAVRLPSGESLTLSPGGQNVLIEKIIHEFASRYTPDGEVLYIGDADDKFVRYEKRRLEELGIVVDTHGKMPDVVIFYTDKQWLVLVEAVTSHGPVNPQRHTELAQLFHNSKVGLVYVTAFLDRRAMKKYLDEISWETEVWVAESPSHLIHFDGKRFLGPY